MQTYCTLYCKRHGKRKSPGAQHTHTVVTQRCPFSNSHKNMKGVNIKERAGGKWRYKVLERVPGWGFLVGVKSLSRTGAEGWMCHRRPGDLWGPAACAVPPQATVGETKRELGSVWPITALCQGIQGEREGTAEGRKLGEWRERKVLWTTTQETHTCVSHHRIALVTSGDLWPVISEPPIIT